MLIFIPVKCSTSSRFVYLITHQWWWGTHKGLLVWDQLFSAGCLWAPVRWCCPIVSPARGVLPLSQHFWDLSPSVGWDFIIASSQSEGNVAIDRGLPGLLSSRWPSPSNGFMIWSMFCSTVETCIQWKIKWNSSWLMWLSLIMKDSVLDSYREKNFFKSSSQRTTWKFTLLKIAHKSLYLDRATSRNPKSALKMRVEMAS